MKSTPYNLVMSAMFNGRKGDRPPVGNPTSVVCHDLMDAARVSFPQAHLDSQAMADLALAGHEILGFDTVMPEFSVQQEAAALGSKVDWGHRDMMPDTKSSPHEDFSDIEVPENLLEQPSMRVVLDALSILRRHVGGKVAIVGKVMGPLDALLPHGRCGKFPAACGSARNGKDQQDAAAAGAGVGCFCEGSVSGRSGHRRGGRSRYGRPGRALSL